VASLSQDEGSFRPTYLLYKRGDVGAELREGLYVLIQTGSTHGYNLAYKCWYVEVRREALKLRGAFSADEANRLRTTTSEIRRSWR